MLVPCQNVVRALAVSILGFWLNMLLKQSDNVLIDQEHNLTFLLVFCFCWFFFPQAVITHTEITTEIVNQEHPVNVTCLSLIMSTHMKNQKMFKM